MEAFCPACPFASHNYVSVPRLKLNCRLPSCAVNKAAFRIPRSLFLGASNVSGLASKKGCSISLRTPGVIRKRLRTVAVVEDDPRQAGADKKPLSEEQITQRMQRTVFDQQAWTKHRSTARYFRNARSIFASRVLLPLITPIVWCGCVAAAFCLYEDGVIAGTFPAFFTDFAPKTLVPLSLSGFLLSLLLVFRTNNSYDRWLDARRMWATLESRCRDLMRQGGCWFGDSADQEHLLQELGGWTIAFARTLKWHLRFGEEGALDQGLEDVLGPAGMRKLLLAQHKPLVCLQEIGGVIQRAKLEYAEKVQMDKGITALEDVLGGCERILRTPIPLPYTRHTTRFLIIWLNVLPMSLWFKMGWMTPVITMIFAFLLLGIEQIGLQIEEPFSILPLESICDTIQEDVMEAVRSKAATRQYMAGF